MGRQSARSAVEKVFAVDHHIVDLTVWAMGSNLPVSKL